MVIITLDNIIPYHPPPAKLPPKPSQPHPSISSGLRPSAKTTLSLIHPLPQHPLRPSFPACVNSSPSDKVNTYSAPDSGLGEHTIPVYSNAFDMELAKHDWVVTKDATADVDTDGDSSEQWQNDFVNDIQRRQQDGSCNYNDKHDADNLRPASKDFAPQVEGSGASAAAESELSSSTQAGPVCPACARGSTEPKVSCHVDGPFVMENEGTQYPMVVRDGMQDGMTVGATSHTPTAYESSDSHGEYSLHDTGSLMAPQCGRESTNIPLLDCSSGEIVDLDLWELAV
ncbi:hypothetical protein T310_3747 [Rasamsonia emersonii CBS 393.64]|uniref:Uncharacterized protein n=1 Tax=Rasamsonia emersonii (strain ATCC 16479 / CBS 393.64 / IMI 116815) TaxID=1408163 RepID=A0A0F4YX79_RASE3|nr:hypothetical protein T310_3747 [Rasamsonia emersonii CBS 393.64]KKA22218.1 hypothetical protein T310_3747 [Rasamsonia emersonii CBS 393.64]